MKTLKLIIRDISQLREKMKSFIKNLPEANTGVTLLSKSPRCGIINLSTIAKNKSILGPSYYLNATAKDELIKILETTDIECLEKKINKIIKTGRISDLPGLVLNPEFVNELKKIWEE